VFTPAFFELEVTVMVQRLLKILAQQFKYKVQLQEMKGGEDKIPTTEKENRHT
jgi:hypothetical protein